MLTTSRLQRTIARATAVRGIGFILGSDVTLRFLPSGADSGIVFSRIDLPGRPTVRASIGNVVPRKRRTALERGSAVVEMVEHVMAALAGLQIDNCLIEIDAPDTPGLDGSSLAYVQALTAAGTTLLNRPRVVLEIDRPVAVREGATTLVAQPVAGPVLELVYHLEYPPEHPIGSQKFELAVSPEAFRDELAGSRTFLLEAEARELRRAGIGKRATEADLLVFGPAGPLGNSLRHPDECARHKVLDLVGDLALLEMDVHGRLIAHRSGHQQNASLVRLLAEMAGADRSAA